MIRYNFNKEENDKFQQEINKTLKFEKYIAKKKNPYNGENAKRDEVFRDIINSYKNKGLKVPDLSTDKNLFKPSALLIEDGELKNYFQIKKGEKNHKGFDEKESYFISKVNNLLYKRLQELDVRANIKDPKGSKTRQHDINEMESNTFQANLLGIHIPTSHDDYTDLDLKSLKLNINKLKSQNEDIKESIQKFQENNNDYYDSDSEEKNKKRRLNSPNKNKKTKMAYQDSINRLAQPKINKSLELNVVELKKDPEAKILKAINEIIGEKNNPYKPIMKSNDGKIIKDGNVYSQFLNNLKKKIDTKTLTKFPNVFNSTNCQKRGSWLGENVNKNKNRFSKSGSKIINTKRKEIISNNNTRYNDRDFSHNNFSNEYFNDKEKYQEMIEAQLRNKDIDNDQFKDLMIAYGKKYSHYEDKYLEELINMRRIEATNIMKGIGDIKHKIDYLDLKETYLDSFLSIGKFDQGATLMKIKYFFFLFTFL